MPVESKNLTIFLENLIHFTPEQRDKMIRLLEYTIIPKYEVSGNAPIEEEWLRRTGQPKSSLEFMDAKDGKSVLLP